MQPDSDDEAWRAIVDNYGDRPRLDPDDARGEDPGADGRDDDGSEWETEEPQGSVEDEDRFVPPPPPPLPRVAPDRLAAWVGVFGAPSVLLTALVLGVHISAWLGYLLVAAFVGGFIYLVSQMPRGPRDPFDDGARL